MSRRIRTLVAVVSLALMGTALTVPAAAAPKPGASCPRAGNTMNIAGMELRCKKRGGKLVWVNIARPGGSSGSQGSGGSGSGSSGSASNSVTSSAGIPKVMQNWGLAVAPYDAATGKAGVMQIRGVRPPTFSNPSDAALYQHLVGLYGAESRGRPDPQMVFVAPLGTPVISVVDGTVCDLPVLYSNDYSVRVAPTGTSCSGSAAAYLFEHEHVINPTVRVGDKVTAGQQLGVVSDYNQNWKGVGLGLVDIGVFFSKTGGTEPWHACPALFLAPGVKDSLLSTLTSIQNAWMTERGDQSLYNLADQNPVGCATASDLAG